MSTVAEVIESVEPEGRRVDRSASVPYEGDTAVMYFFRTRTSGGDVR